MPKVLSDNTQSNSRYFGKGVFVDKCKIISVQDMSNYPKNPGAEVKTIGSNNFRTELCLILKVDAGFEMDMYIMGNYNWKTDPISGKKLGYIGWKKAGNAVQNLLYKVLGDKAIINDDDSIAATTLNALPGKEFYRLRYCKRASEDYEGRPSFAVWNTYSSVFDGAEEDLVTEFHKISTKIQKYDPLHFEDYTEKQKKQEESFAPGDDEDVI